MPVEVRKPPSEWMARWEALDRLERLAKCLGAVGTDLVLSVLADRRRMVEALRQNGSVPRLSGVAAVFSARHIGGGTV